MKQRDFRRLRGLTLPEFARMIGVHPVSAARYECGMRQPAKYVVKRIIMMTSGLVTGTDYDDLKFASRIAERRIAKNERLIG